MIGLTLEMPGAAPEAASAVCGTLGIEHRVIDSSELLQRCVIDRFAATYAAGMTPNPCVICNDLVKSRVLMNVADDSGFERIVTGHYARIRIGDDGPHLLRAKDRSRDQSYMLYRLSQEVLGRFSFPVGELSKKQVRRLANEADLPAADRPESQDICFAADMTEIMDLIARRHPEALEPGPIIDGDGRVLGEHRGIAAYTVGQRRGLGIGGQDAPFYVLRILPESNALVAGPEEELWRDECDLDEVRLIGSPPGECFEATVATRYRGRETPAQIQLIDDNRASLRFARPHRAPAPGQSAVFYAGERCLGGGIIQPVAGA